jgi:nicotinamide-nucleotide amidase
MSIKVCIINIGNELLLGQTVNTNLSWLGRELAAIGLPVNRSYIVRDEADEIRNALKDAWQEHEIVLVSGGLGPTRDDITKTCLADFFHKQSEFREDVWVSVKAIFQHRGLEVPEINRSQAMVPEGFTAFINHNGTAPGLYFSSGDKKLFALPGVPLELKGLFSEYIRPLLQKEYALAPVFIKTIHTWGISESALAEKIKTEMIPETVQLAWLPQTGRVDLRLYGQDREQVESCAEDISRQVTEYVWGWDEETPSGVLHKLLLEKKLTLAAAESCTGGLVQKLITDNPGSSAYFAGGVISYSNAVKNSLLKVSEQTLEQHGAVSLETAEEMAEGVRTLLTTDIGISVTGIAGPEGGSKEKPVGLVCFSVSADGIKASRKTIFNGDRQLIRWKAAEYIILMLTEQIRSL